MAKVSNTDLLAGILSELTELVENSKGGKSSGKDSAASKALSSSLNPESVKQLKDTGDGLSNMVNAIKAMREIDIKKDMDHMGSIFKSIQDMMSGFKMDEEKAKAFSLFMSSFGKMNEAFINLSLNFFKNFRAFSPIKGKLLGKRLAEFYKAISDAFSESKGVIGVGELLSALGSLDGKKMVQMSQWMRLLNRNGGQRLADFLLPIIKVINEMPEALENKNYKSLGLFKEESNSSWMANPKIAGFISVLNALSSITVGQINRLALMELMLGPKGGEKIGGFFHEFLNKFTKEDTEKVKVADKVIRGVAIIFGTLTGTLIALTVLAAVGKEKVVYGLGLLTIMCIMTLGVIKLLSKKEIKANAKESVFTALSFAAIITSLTLSLILCTKIAKEYKAKDIFGGIAILAGLIGFSLLTMKLLGNKKVQENGVKSLITIAGIILMITGLSLVARLFVKNGENWAKILKGTIATAAVGLAGIGLIYLAAQLDKGTLVKGLLGMAGVLAAVIGITLATKEYMSLIKVIGNTTDKDILRGSRITSLIITAVTGAMIGLGFLLGTPAGAAFAIGFAGMESISLAIYSLSSAIDNFVSMLEHINKLTPESVKNAKDIITGTDGLVACIKEIVDGLDGVSVKRARQIKRIARNLNPVFKGLSNFVDIIQKMGNMTMFEGYDENGKPIYTKMSNTAFTEAANTLSTGFTDFLAKLFNTFKGKNAEKIKEILKALRKGGVSDLMLGLGTFGQTVVNMAQMRIPDKWDSNGNPIHYLQIGKEIGEGANAVFLGAAETLSSAFSTFLTILNNSFVDGKDAKKMKKIIRALKRGGITELMTALGQFGETITTLAVGQVPVYEDANDPTKITGYIKPDYENAATVLSNAFSAFIDGLIPIQAKVVNININRQTRALELMEEVFASFAKLNKNNFEKDDLYNKVKYAGKTLSLFASYLVLFNNQLKPIGGIEKQGKQIADAFDKIEDALKKFDNELISKDEKRRRALDNLANKFSEINTNIEKLNTNFAKSTELVKQYDALQYKQNNGMMIQAVGVIKDRVNNFANTVKKANEDVNKKNELHATIDPTPIVAAIIDGLNQWADSQRIVSIQFGDNDARKIRGYIN